MNMWKEHFEEVLNVTTPEDIEVPQYDFSWLSSSVNGPFSNSFVVSTYMRACNISSFT